MYNDNMPEEIHQPVLLEAVLKVLQPQPGESYLDLTAGYAGHASRILDVTQNYKDAVLVDRDAFAVEWLTRKFAGTPVEIKQTNFYNAALQEIQCGRTFDLILADFGVSSPQLDQEERGFAFAKSGPLDMRMDQRQTLTADTIINHASTKELTDIFVRYGELSPRRAQTTAQKIVHGRPWQDTVQLATQVAGPSRGRKHPATQIFQALRIAVNDELGEIERTLPLLPQLLKPGGRVALISFHSLEDRLVKQYFKEVSSYGEESKLKILTKTPITAEHNELVINPRARSAKLRAAIATV